ncbi:MAG: hypothetical protein U0165_18910 [Polyangiaceae bacterium]
MNRRWLGWVTALLVATGSTLVFAAPTRVDRVVYVFESPETGGASAPLSVFERELALEARIEAMSVGEPLADSRGAYAERFVRSALDRHVATELLASLPVERSKTLTRHPCDGPATEADEADLQRRMKLARALLVARIKGADRLEAAAEAENVGEEEIAKLVRREALASRYLDMMVAPMLAPSDGELREILHGSPTPFRGRSFDDVRCDLRRWVLTQRIGAALSAFLQSARTRVRGRWTAR